MFELFDGVYAERIESGHYRIFSDDQKFSIFIKINSCIDRKVMARLVRNIAREINEIKQAIEADCRRGG